MADSPSHLLDDEREMAERCERARCTYAGRCNSSRCPKHGEAHGLLTLLGRIDALRAEVERLREVVAAVADSPSLPHLLADEREMLERAEAATPGPWRDHLCHWGRSTVERHLGDTVDRETWRGSLINGEPVEHIVGDNHRNGGSRPEDAAFIAAARTDLPTLLGRIDALRAEVERLREVVAGTLHEASNGDERMAWARDCLLRGFVPSKSLDKLRDAMAAAQRDEATAYRVASDASAEAERMRTEAEDLRRLLALATHKPESIGQARASALEDAAKACEAWRDEPGTRDMDADVALSVAAARIRALAGKAGG